MSIFRVLISLEMEVVATTRSVVVGSGGSSFVVVVEGVRERDRVRVSVIGGFAKK